MRSDYSILVMSCDKYSDLWEPFVRCLKKYWPDCPASVYFVGESKSDPHNAFRKSILCGTHLEWTDRLGVALKEVTDDYLLLLCDDYLLCDRVNNEILESILSFSKKHRIGNFRLNPNPMPSQTLPSIDGIEVGEYPPGASYRIATQAGFWQKEYLKKFTNLGTSIWGFERMGSKLSNRFEERTLCSLRQVFPFEDAVHKGKWERSGLRLCERNDIRIDPIARQKMTEKDYLVKHLKGYILEIFPHLVTTTINAVSLLKKWVRGLFLSSQR